MAGHSHWAGIKHKKGKADKQRSAIFSKLSREITVAAKLGDKNPDMNSRLRSAIQAARSANMPKDNIERAIDKSSMAADSNFENIRYEGFGPSKTAVVVTTIAVFAGPNPSYLIFSKLVPAAIDDLSIALSILSLGIFADLAAWIADLNLEFISGFLSPSFAATVISLDSFEKIAALCLSAFPFLCLMPAQWEWPAMI